MSQGDLSGKTALVTGGTGALGGAVVAALLAEGARVAVPYRKGGDLERWTGTETRSRERCST